MHDAFSQTSRWVLGPGRLKGQTAYDYVARGRGAMDGIVVLWGRAPDAPEGSPLRRFKVLIGSEVLWRHRSQGETAADVARLVLGALERDLYVARPIDELVQVRRVDVCLDHWGYRWDQDDLKRFACRQRSRALDVRSLRDGEKPPEGVQVYRGAQSETYYVGSRGAASRFLRVYNKIVEAAKTGKLPWMEPAWRAHGWDGRKTVWRAEIEHGGDWLKDHGLESLAKLDGCEHQLWRAYVEDVRHTTGNATRLKRASTSRVWKCLRGAIGRAERTIGAVGSWKWMPRPPNPEADTPTLTALWQGTGRKVRDRLFPNVDSDPVQREAFIAFMFKAMEAGDRRAEKRAAQLAQLGRAPPRRPPAPPTPPARTA